MQSISFGKMQIFVHTCKKCIQIENYFDTNKSTAFQILKLYVVIATNVAGKMNFKKNTNLSSLN